MNQIKLFFIWLLFPIILIFKKRQSKIKDKIESVTIEYDLLIEQYRLIQERKSTLSSRERKLVQARVIDLIGRGHIKVSRNEAN